MKGLKKHLHCRLNAIILLLEKPVRSFTPSTFHKLRLEIKKLNSFYELIEFSSKDFKRSKAARPFLQIFRQAGKVREIQVEELLLKKYFSNTMLVGYRKNLRIKKINERIAFFKLVNKHAVKRMKNSGFVTAQLLSTIDKKKVLLYFKEKKKKILKNFFQCDFRPEQIHRLRKLLKCYYFNKSIIEKGIHNSISDKQAQLTELLGNWHDLHLIGIHLRRAITQGQISLADIVPIERTEALISATCEKKLSQLKTAVSGFSFSEVI